ncbi:histone H1/5 [Cryptococcus neoformans Tu259-1]|uniref:Histone H1 n=1 Tax=Cryptococcus neoformans Tu259-1 TaxID=1230072 RepID=A0A854QEX6_CRYNE|nr:histone H1/5 [Cryptococcus neoformans var. grubii 125.91]OXG15799.1 histone H1/5 [Cryptococcus neoformans var. grubii Tu259-1]
MAPVKKTTAAPKKAASHPPFLAMIQEAISNHPTDSKKGVSRVSIKKYLEDKYKLDMSAAGNTSNLNGAIKRAVEKNELALPGGPSGRVKLVAAAKPKAAEKKPAAKKSAAAKPAEKKTTTKAAPKKAASATTKKATTAKPTAAKAKAAAPAKKTVAKSAATKKTAEKKTAAPKKAKAPAAKKAAAPKKAASKKA